MPSAPSKSSLIHAAGVLRFHGPGTWTVLHLNASAGRRLGSKGKIRVRGTVNGRPYESTTIPNGDGTYSLLITKSIQASAGVVAGDRVRVKLVAVSGARPILAPTELVRALSANPRARARFSALAPSYRRAWAEHVANAKGQLTRERRAALSVARILSGVRTPKG